MKYYKLICIIPLIFLLSSCLGEEPNDIAYITAIGIDKDNSKYNYTIQFANPTKISGGAAEEGGSGGNIVENIVVEAPTLYKAISNAEAIISKDLSVSHAKIVVISEEIAKEGTKGILDAVARNNDIRPDIFISVAENSKEYLEEVKPVIELNPVKYYQLTYKNKKGDYIPQGDARNFYVSYISGDKDSVLPLAGVAQTNESSEETNTNSNDGGNKDEKPKENLKNKDSKYIKSGFEHGIKNYYAGQAGVEVKNKSEAIGMAVFKGDKYIGKLGSGDAGIYNILKGKAKGSRATFYSGKGVPMTVQLEQKISPTYNIDKERKHVTIHINIESNLLSEPGEDIHANSKHRDTKNSEMMNKAVEEFLDKTYHKMNVDVLGIKGKLKRFFLTNKAYSEYIKDFSPDEWNFEVKTDLEMKRTGMTTELE